MSFPIVYQNGYVIPACHRTNYLPTNPRVGPPGASVAWNSKTGVSTLVANPQQPQSIASWTLPSSANSGSVPIVKADSAAAILTLSSNAFNARVAPSSVAPLPKSVQVPTVSPLPSCPSPTLTYNCSSKVVIPGKASTSCIYPQLSTPQPRPFQ